MLPVESRDAPCGEQRCSLWRAGILSAMSSEFPFEAKSCPVEKFGGSQRWDCRYSSAVAEHSPAISAGRLSAAPANEPSAVAAGKWSNTSTAAVSADKKSSISQDMPTALPRWPQCGNGIGLSWVVEDTLSADTADVFPADTADVFICMRSR